MTAPGMPVSYWVLDRDGFFYTGFGRKWSSHLHFAVPLSEELAEKLSRRYPGSIVDRNYGYEIHPREHLADVGEPEAVQAIEKAIRLAKADGLSLPTIMVQVERVYDSR